MWAVRVSADPEERIFLVILFSYLSLSPLQLSHWTTVLLRSCRCISQLLQYLVNAGHLCGWMLLPTLLHQSQHPERIVNITSRQLNIQTPLTQKSRPRRPLKSIRVANLSMKKCQYTTNNYNSVHLMAAASDVECQKSVEWFQLCPRWENVDIHLKHIFVTEKNDTTLSYSPSARPQAHSHTPPRWHSV